MSLIPLMFRAAECRVVDVSLSVILVEFVAILSESHVTRSPEKRKKK